MDITEVARRSGLTTSTLRYYEERGLIESVGRQGLRRLFGPGVLQRLALITLGRAAGFTLDEIRTMFTPSGAPQIDRGLLAAKAAQIDATVARMRAMSNSLKHAARCPAENHLACPSFRRLLDDATRGALDDSPLRQGELGAGPSQPRPRVRARRSSPDS